MQLAPCTQCRRHIRVDAVCPFCGGEASAPREIAIGRSRRVAVLFASALGVAGCSDDNNVVAVYGAPAPDTGLVDTSTGDTSTTDTAVTDSATSDTSPSDTGADTPADSKDTGAAVPPYGAPEAGS